MLASEVEHAVLIFLLLSLVVPAILVALWCAGLAMFSRRRRVRVVEVGHGFIRLENGITYTLADPSDAWNFTAGQYVEAPLLYESTFHGKRSAP